MRTTKAVARSLLSVANGLVNQTELMVRSLELIGKLCLILCAILLVLNAHASEQLPILILHSYSEEYPWTKRQHEGFVKALATDAALAPTYAVEYLDTKRRPYNENYGSQFADYLRFKYSGYQPALIYATDDDALLFAQKFSNRLFPGAAIFFSGVNDYGKRDKLDPAQATGVFEKKDIATNLAVLLRMVPALRDIIVVGDGSSTYVAIAQDARAELEKLPSIHATFIAEQRLDRLLEQLRGQAGAYLLLTTMGGLTDKNGRALLLSQSIPEIVRLKRFTVLSMEDVYMFEGVLGGYVTSGKRQGEMAGQLALSYVHGTPLAQLTPVLESPNEYLFDEDELDRLRLRLPADIEAVSTLLNQKPSFYQQNKNLIIASLGVLAVLLFWVVLGSLIIVARKNRLVRYSEEQYREAQRIGRVGSYAYDIMADQWHSSKVLDEILGIGPDYPRNLEGWCLLVHESQRSDLKAYFRDIVARHGRFDKEYRIANSSDESERWVMGMGEVECDHEGKPLRLVGMIQDITESKQAAEALERLNETLERRVQEELAKNREKDHLLIQQSRFAAMGEMIGNIAHQWRQPLNTLMLALANIEDAYHYQELTGEYLAAQVAEGKRIIHKMSSTIDDFRNFFRPHKEVEPFSLAQAIKDSLSLVSASFHNYHIEVGLEAGEDAIIDGFSNEYSQVLINLLVNAKEAILANHIACGKVTIRLTHDGRSATVSVTDNGGGIDVALLEKIFEPYFSTKEMGTGIGLYMSKMIIEKSMHGQLTVRSNGTGAEFAIRCPLSARIDKSSA